MTQRLRLWIQKSHICGWINKTVSGEIDGWMDGVDREREGLMNNGWLNGAGSNDGHYMHGDIIH